MGRAHVSVTQRCFTSIRKRQGISLKKVVSCRVLNTRQSLKALRWLRNSCRNLKGMTVNCFFPTLDSKQIAHLRRCYIVPPHVAHHSVVKTNTVGRGDACPVYRQSNHLVCWKINSSQKEVLWVFKASQTRSWSSTWEFIRGTTRWSPGLSLPDLIVWRCLFWI